MIVQRKNRKICLAERLKHAESQEDWPVRYITIANEYLLLQITCNYIENGLTFEESFVFTAN